MRAVAFGGAHLPTAVALAACLLLVVGCGRGGQEYLTEQRMSEGLVVILPGIEGESSINRDIRRGLDQAGVQAAMPIRSWGRPIPIAGMMINQMDVIGNRMAGDRIAGEIRQYQRSYPGRPVYVVGHSGGGGIAVFVAESMGGGERLDGLVLLSASISSTYDLTDALRNTRRGIVSFYNPRDVGMLGLGTAFAGTVDGARGASAGLEGFAVPAPGEAPERRDAYRKLYQVEMPTGRRDPHTAATRPDFVAGNVAPWIQAERWPAGDAHLADGADSAMFLPVTDAGAITELFASQEGL